MKFLNMMDRIRDTPQIEYDGAHSEDTWRNSGWAELPFFLATARSGTLRAAAQRMKVNHATVDRHIKALEDAYGVALFERNPKGLTLTPAGVSLLKKAEAAEAAVIDARRKVSGLDDRPAGPVHLSLSAWHARYHLTKDVVRFREAYPEIELRVSVSDQLVDLTKSSAEVSMRAGWQVDDNVHARKLSTYNAAVLASRDYIERHWDSRGPKGEGLHWIGKSTLWPNPKLEEMNLFPSAKRDLDVRDPLLINELLCQGYGMAIVPLNACRFHPELMVVPGTPVASDRTLWVLYHSDLRNSARVQIVVDFLTEMWAKSRDFELDQIEQFKKLGQPFI